MQDHKKATFPTHPVEENKWTKQARLKIIESSKIYGLYNDGIDKYINRA